MKLEKIKNSYIYYDEEYLFYVREYYLYCVHLLKDILFQESRPVNLIVGDYKYSFPGFGKTLRIDFQFEHTLVKPGGRDSDNAIEGNIGINSRTNYLVRIANFDRLRRCDLVIDYSIPNLINIGKSGRFPDFFKKCVCISPVLYDIETFSSLDRFGTISTFVNPNEERRCRFLSILRNYGIDIENVVDVYNKKDVYQLYKKSRVLINIHQTDHHHTFEELRVLPALLCGCLVISENVPLKDSIPYSKFVIWSDIEGIADKILDVDKNYEKYYYSIFGSAEFSSIVAEMTTGNKKVLSDFIRSKSISWRNSLCSLVKYFQRSPINLNC